MEGKSYSEYLRNLQRWYLSPQIENLQMPVDVVARWVVDSFEDQEQNTIIFIEMLMHSRDDPTHRLEYDCLHPQGIVLPFPFL